MTSSSSNRRRPLIAGLVIIVSIVAGFALRSHFQHAHGHGHSADHGATELSLHDGQRWETDEPLRLGMQRIRDAVAIQLKDGNVTHLTPSKAKALAATIQENVTYLIENCQLTPAADSNLHVIINDLLASASYLTAGDQSGEAIAKLHHALSAYPRYFNHPNWSPLHSTTP